MKTYSVQSQSESSTPFIESFNEYNAGPHPPSTDRRIPSSHEAAVFVTVQINLQMVSTDVSMSTEFHV